MSCRGRCGSGNTPSPRTLNAPERSATAPSHRTVHVNMERSPTRPDPIVASLAELSGYGNLRIPPAARASTPGPYGYPSQFETYGSQIDYNLSWMPKDINLSELLDQTSSQVSSRFRRMDQNITHTPSNLPPPSAESTPVNANLLLGQELSRPEEESPNSKKEKQESLIQWFDRSVEKELKKHKGSTLSDLKYSSPGEAQDQLPENPIPELDISKGLLHKMAGATASQLEICFDLRKQPDTDLTDAVEKLAKAEAMCSFAGAVKAAEAAAESAPPELVEEAALASAKGYQTDVKTTGIHGELEGVRPIEVLGYIGLTKPKYPIKKQ